MSIKQNITITESSSKEIRFETSREVIIFEKLKGKNFKFYF